MFTNSLEGPVLDHRYYAGGCTPHYIMDTKFRKPYNVESYFPQVSDSLGINAGCGGVLDRPGEHTWAWSCGLPSEVFMGTLLSLLVSLYLHLHDKQSLPLDAVERMECCLWEQ